MRVGRVGEAGICPGLHASLRRLRLHIGHEVERVVGLTEQSAARMLL